jgi:hypothetical protein
MVCELDGPTPALMMANTLIGEWGASTGSVAKFKVIPDSPAWPFPYASYRGS